MSISREARNCPCGAAALKPYSEKTLTLTERERSELQFLVTTAPEPNWKLYHLLGVPFTKVHLVAKPPKRPRPR